MQRLKKIDLHCHTITEKMVTMAGDWCFATPDELRKIYQDLGVEKALLLPLTDAVAGPQSQSMSEIYHLVRDNPDIFGWWFCNFNPRMLLNDPELDLSYYLLQLKEKGARGVGELAENVPFDDPYMLNLFRHCERCQMPVLFHVGQLGQDYGVFSEVGLGRLEKALFMFPNLIFIGHSTKFWNEISGDCGEKPRGVYHGGPVTEGGRVPTLMRKYKNLHCDISAGSGYNALTRDPEFTYAFFEEFQDRIYYGADVCTPHCYDNPLMKMPEFLDTAMETGKISEEAYRKICRENALKLLEGKGE